MSKQKFSFPTQATSVNDLLETVKQKKQKDIDWKKGRAFCLIYYPGEEREKAIKAVFDQYYADNALNPTATPSLAELETEAVSMCADLFHGDDQVCGNITTGGTESILLAVKTSRDWAQKNKPNITKPHVVIPDSAHPAFMKAFQIMNVEYPFGVMDPITDIAALALKKKLLFHVDACIGGFLLPFVKELGYPVPNFDFAVEGVTSLSADIHKYGYSPKGASVILYRTHELRRFQFSLYTKWAGGIYASPTITGTRAGGNIAGAWAAIRSIGRDGYLEMAKTTMQTTEQIKTAISQIEELDLIGEPDMSIVAFKSSSLDVYILADELNKKGWHFERQQLPPSLHFTVNYIHRDIIDDFIHDFKAAVAIAREKRMAHISNRVTSSVVKGLSKILPDGAIAKFQKNSTQDLNNENKAAMYGMMGALSGTGDLDEIVLDFLDTIYTAKS
jgi:sphinganine-1-phosphate aldolase